MQCLALVLAAYDKAGVRLNPKKCLFMQSQIEFLGHELDQHGLRPLPTYVKSVQDWPLPTKKQEIRAFLGFVNYYRAHIPSFSAMTAEWSDVMGKTSKEAEKNSIHITPSMKNSFYKLKDCLTKAPTLGYPYFKGPKAGSFILDTDHSARQRASSARSKMAKKLSFAMDQRSCLQLKGIGPQQKENCTAASSSCTSGLTSSTTFHSSTLR